MFQNKKVIVIVVAAIVILGAFIFFSPSKKTTTTTAPILNGTPAGPNAVYVPDQKPADKIFVSVVVLKEPGYIVIHREENGAPGAVVGVSEYFKAGEYWKTSVQLKVTPASGSTLFAMLHKDNGDQTFSVTDDLPVGLEKKEVIMMQFKVDERAPESADMK